MQRRVGRTTPLSCSTLMASRCSRLASRRSCSKFMQPAVARLAPSSCGRPLALAGRQDNSPALSCLNALAEFSHNSRRRTAALRLSVCLERHLRKCLRLELGRRPCSSSTFMPPTSSVSAASTLMRPMLRNGEECPPGRGAPRRRCVRAALARRLREGGGDLTCAASQNGPPRS